MKAQLFSRLSGCRRLCSIFSVASDLAFLNNGWERKFVQRRTHYCAKQKNNNTPYVPILLYKHYKLKL